MDKKFERKLLKAGWTKIGDTLYSPDYDPSEDEEEEEEEEYYGSGDFGCTACGNPAYPDCKSSCPLFDD